jgi:UDP-2,4-diacetamido-2,4,6-trideoxy-beta-L-altropyranose hydrolase
MTQAEPARRVAFRVDASAQIGGGHAMRCLALAGGFADRGLHVSFFAGAGTSQAVPALARSGHATHVVAADAGEALSQMRAAHPRGVDLLVVDHYGLGASFEQAGRDWAREILAIEDVPNRRHAASILTDPTYGRAVGDYADLVPSATTLLVGSDYALLRPEFARRRPAALAARGRNAARALVAMGNADPSDMTSHALAALERAAPEIAVDVLLGSGSPNVAQVRAAVARLGPSARLHLDSDAVADLMAHADLCVGACGSTAWERCALGLPTVGVVTATNQASIAANLERAGALLWVRAAHDEPALVAAIGALVRDDKLRAEMSRKAARICDANGVGRVVEAVVAKL